MKHAARFSLFTLLCVAIVLPSMLSGCSPGGTRAHVATAISTLAAGGVPVYESYSGGRPIEALQGPRSAMRFTRWQLTNLVRQADAGMGIVGATIDHMEKAKAPKGAPTLSYFIAAWLVRDSGPLAHYAKQLMGTNTDYKHAPRLTFPLLVVSLFIADAARMPNDTNPPTSQHGFNVERLFAAPADASGICSTVASFISQTITDVTNALSIKSHSWFATLWNVAIRLVVGLTEVVIAGVLYPLIKILNAVAGGLAALTMIASTMQTWTVALDPQPLTPILADTPVDGKIVATLTAPSIDWPSEVTDCAQVLTGVELDKITYKDAPVTWTTGGNVPDLASIGTSDDKIDDDKHATLSYTTVTRPAEPKPECTSLHIAGNITAHIFVKRTDIIHAEEQLAKLAFNQLPPLVKNHLMPMFEPQLGAAYNQFSQLLSTPTVADTTVEIMEHQPDSTKCTPPPTKQTPSPKPEEHSAILGAWACDMTRTTTIKDFGPFTVHVHETQAFYANGMSSGGVSPDTKYSSSYHHASVGDTGSGPTGNYPYTYTSHGSDSGTLVVGGHTYPITWNGKNAYTMPIHGKDFTANLVCARK